MERTYQEMVTDQQKALYMNNRKDNCLQKIAAAKAGFSERTGSRIDNNVHQKGRPHNWKTRDDVFEEVWEQDIITWLKNGVFEATFILEELQKKHPGKFADSTLRTLQRRIKKWKALYGPEKEVMFRQKHEPGDLGISDFTHPNEIQVTINGEVFKHIFYHFRLPYSGFNYVQVFRGSGEPYEAFAQGLQEALLYIGGAPKKHRTDSLSASYKNLNKDASEDLTERYRAFVEHFNMQATRINPGKSHENGSIESSHGHFKKRVYQSLKIRSSNDFSSLDEYREFIHEVLKEHNKHACKDLETEREHLLPLPATKAADYAETTVVVSSSSVIDVRRVTYSVYSRLIGEKLHVRIYSDKLECYLGHVHVITLERKFIPPHNGRARQISYGHLIEGLAKKPGAFRGFRFRDELFPNADYRYIWEYVDRVMNDKDACKFIVGLIHLAATQHCEEELARTVICLIKQEKTLNLYDLQYQFKQAKNVVPIIQTQQHSLAAYNDLIPNNMQGLQHG
jgi:hypothetical protein